MSTERTYASDVVPPIAKANSPYEFFSNFRRIRIRLLHRDHSLFSEPEERAKESEEERAEEAEETEEQDVTEYTEDISYSAYSDEHLRIVQPSEDEGEEETETQELEGTLSVKSEEGSRVKKFVVSYETKVLKSPSPAPSHGK